MESCLKHRKKYDEAIVNLVEGNDKLHDRVDKRSKETEGLKSRVLELETRNVLLKAKVGWFRAENLFQLRIIPLGRVACNSRSPDAR